jgi:hypothetical protein
VTGVGEELRTKKDLAQLMNDDMSERNESLRGGEVQVIARLS